MNVELLSPAGDFDTAVAAFAYGADAVYCGLSDFSARAFAKNLSREELSLLVAHAHSLGKKTYVTFNTVIDDRKFPEAIETLSALDDIGVDALVVQDLGVARTVRKHFPGMELHASTQLVAHNLEGVLALRDIGFRRVVLARELSIDEIRSIARRCGTMKTADDGRPEMELEVFVHGALCYSLSGLCLFGAMEKGRSGNRGMCPYCCRQNFARKGETPFHPFSMKDLRAADEVVRLVDAGVSSLKIEGRMKSSLYVASVTAYYRQILDESRSENAESGVGGQTSGKVTEDDLETVFSRRTTKLYLDGRGESPIDGESIGHVGLPIGEVKKVTRDREGVSWLRFHTDRALEKHDGLQFDVVGEDGRRLGMGISEMRLAISRAPVFEVAAGSDVEVLVDDALGERLAPGMTIYCSMSNAVKRRFPQPSFRPGGVEGGAKIDVVLELRADGLESRSSWKGREVRVGAAASLSPARNYAGTADVARRAFSRLGGTGYRLGEIEVRDPDGLFAPMGVLNELRRELVSALDEERARLRRERVDEAVADDCTGEDVFPARRRLKIRLGQKVPAGNWDEIVVAIAAGDPEKIRAALPDAETCDAKAVRLALPVYTPEPGFGRLRTTVNRLVRGGFAKWECSDLATLRMLKMLGVEDMTADWTLYAFNTRALAELSAAGVRRFVASPENGRENVRNLAESGYDVEFLVQQSTPLFVSLTRPETGGEDVPKVDGLAVFRRDGLWVTTKPSPRTFDAPGGASVRIDLSWDPET